MTTLTLFPGKWAGTLSVPASKSMGHRALICAALAKGESCLLAMDPSQDLEATQAGIEAMGAQVLRQGKTWIVQGTDKMPSGEVRIPCKESGSTLRFLLPVSLVLGQGGRFLGQGQLGQRPMTPYFDIFQKQGIHYYQEPGPALDLLVKGHLRSGVFSLPGDVSSQFASGLFFALPLLEEDSDLRLEGPLESEAYLAMTIEAMRTFGVEVERLSPMHYRIPGRQTYGARKMEIEGDYSQAAFFIVADVLGSQVKLTGLNPHSLQGDQAVLHWLETMGARARRDGTGLWMEKPARGLQGTVIDGSQCPDIIPILALAAALTPGKTRIVKAGRLRYKECDRLAAVASELGKLGAKITEQPEGLEIEGVESFKGGVRVWSHKDHRIAMMLAVAATCCREPIVLEDSQCVAKSYPHFWEDCRALGGRWQV